MDAVREGQQDRAQLLDEAKARRWYHTLELGPELTTDGWFDLRPFVKDYGLPENMEGMRVLEVGTWDGFWAFEMERRGAAEVIALDLDNEADLDWPPRRRPETPATTTRGDGFRLAKEILGSKVERVNCSVYHATPEELGTFDLVFCGSVLIHLRDQLLAMERIAGLCDGTFVSAEEYDMASGLLPMSVSRFRANVIDDVVVYWRPSIRTWKHMLWTAGFDDIKQHSKFKMKSSEGWSIRHVVFHASSSATA